MSIKNKKSGAVKFLEKLSGGALTFGKLLRSIRLGEGLTLKKFSKSLDISIQHLSDIENDRRLISPERAAKFAISLGYSKAQFVEIIMQDILNQSGLQELRVKLSKAS